jgi:hypothetical protein
MEKIHKRNVKEERYLDCMAVLLGNDGFPAATLRPPPTAVNGDTFKKEPGSQREVDLSFSGYGGSFEPDAVFSRYEENVLWRPSAKSQKS